MVGKAAMIAVLLAPTASIAKHDDHRTDAGTPAKSPFGFSTGPSEMSTAPRPTDWTINREPPKAWPTEGERASAAPFVQGGAGAALPDMAGITGAMQGAAAQAAPAGTQTGDAFRQGLIAILTQTEGDVSTIMQRIIELMTFTANPQIGSPGGTASPARTSSLPSTDSFRSAHADTGFYLA